VSQQRYTERELLDIFPWVKWREPQVMIVGAGTWLTCRFCVARKGIRAQDVPDVGFDRREDFDSHLRIEHPDVAPAA
jgi:hypothetical protein